MVFFRSFVMKPVVLVDKPVGMTPMQAIQAVRTQNPGLKSKRMSHAGRLDPLASGLLVFIVGEETSRLKQYMRLSKVYDAMVLLGVGTDSYDTLGLAEACSPQRIDASSIKKQLISFGGTFMQIVPAFSSVRVQGKALVKHARRGDVVELPQKSVTISRIEHVKIFEKKGGALLKEIEKNVLSLKGDFRQDDVIASWKNVIDVERSYQLVSFRVSCSSGTYIRSLAHDLGKKLGDCGTLFRLRRVKVGHFSLYDAVTVKKKYL